MDKKFTPALGFSALTPLYDFAIRALTRERVWRDLLVRQVNPEAGNRILDVGCGTGSLAIQLKQLQPGAKIMGLDPDSDILKRAERKAYQQHVEIEWIQGFLNEVAVSELQSVSKVVSSLVFHQTPLQEKSEILSAMYRVLEQHGSLHIADYGLQSSRLMRTLFRCTVQTIDGVNDTQANADGVLPALMEAAGFVDVHERTLIRTATGSISLYSARKAI